AQRSAGLQEDLAVTGPGAGLPRAALADVRATKGVSSAVAVTPTMLGPGGVGLSDDVTSAQVLDGGAGGGLDVGMVAGSLAGLHVGDRATLLASADDADRATNRWLTPLLVAIIFAFTSIAVVNTLAMIALRRGRELALLRLSGATRRQVRSMARWEAALIVAIGLGVGLLISTTALLPLSHALTGGYSPFVPGKPLLAILGGST